MNCSFPGCTRPQENAKHGLCAACRMRKHRNGGVLPLTPARPKAPNTYPLTPEGRAAQHAANMQDPEKRKAFQKRLRTNNLRVRSGLTIEDYQRMFDAQGGKCAICQNPGRGKTTLVVDHDHDTNKVRKLLCVPCNRALGYFENPEWFERAQEYLHNNLLSTQHNNLITVRAS